MVASKVFGENRRVLRLGFVSQFKWGLAKAGKKGKRRSTGNEGRTRSGNWGGGARDEVCSAMLYKGSSH